MTTPAQPGRLLTRRRFLRRAGGAAALALIDWPSAAGAWSAAGPVRSRPVRVRGIVRTSAGGLRGVPVTDGLTVVDSLADGTFELVTSSDSPFIYISLPAGHRIPLNPTGTASFYRPIAPEGDEATAVFDLEPLAASDERHAFLVLADIRGRRRESALALSGHRRP